MRHLQFAQDPDIYCVPGTGGFVEDSHSQKFCFWVLCNSCWGMYIGVLMLGIWRQRASECTGGIKKKSKKLLMVFKMLPTADRKKKKKDLSTSAFHFSFLIPYFCNFLLLSLFRASYSHLMLYLPFKDIAICIWVQCHHCFKVNSFENCIPEFLWDHKPGAGEGY